MRTPEIIVSLRMLNLCLTPDVRAIFLENCLKLEFGKLFEEGHYKEFCVKFRLGQWAHKLSLWTGGEQRFCFCVRPSADCWKQSLVLNSLTPATHPNLGSVISVFFFFFFFYPIWQVRVKPQTLQITSDAQLISLTWLDCSFLIFCQHLLSVLCNAAGAVWRFWRHFVKVITALTKNRE